MGGEMDVWMLCGFGRQHKIEQTPNKSFMLKHATLVAVPNGRIKMAVMTGS